MSDTAELAAKANGLGAWARKLSDAVAVIEGAHALEGHVGALRQEQNALMAQIAAERDALALEHARVSAEIEALKADAKKRKEKAAEAQREIDAALAAAAAKSHAIIEDAKGAAQAEANRIIQDTDSLKAERAKAEAEAAEALARAEDARKQAKAADAELARVRKQAAALAGV